MVLDSLAVGSSAVWALYDCAGPCVAVHFQTQQGTIIVLSSRPRSATCRSDYLRLCLPRDCLLLPGFYLFFVICYLVFIPQLLCLLHRLWMSTIYMMVMYLLHLLKTVSWQLFIYILVSYIIGKL
jgi:hypothetical protein